MPFVTNHSRCFGCGESLQIAGTEMNCGVARHFLFRRPLFCRDERFAGLIRHFEISAVQPFPHLLSALFKQLGTSPVQPVW